MAKQKISFILFDLSSNWNILCFEWRKTDIIPDYDYCNPVNLILPDELFRECQIIRLNSIKEPFVMFKFYFTEKRISELKHQIAIFKSGTTDDSLSISNKAARILQENRIQYANHKISKKKSRVAIREFLKKNKEFDNASTAAQILDLKRNSAITLKQIALTLNITTARTSYLWRLLREKNTRFAKYQEKIDNKLLLEQQFEKKLQEYLKNDELRMKPLKTIYAYFAKENPHLPIRITHFRQLVTRYGFCHRHACYRTKNPVLWSTTRLNFAVLLMAQVIYRSDIFEIFWLDESSICPNNFKQRGWGSKRHKLAITSRLKYDGTKLFGILSGTRIFALQFIQGNVSQIIFDFFLIQALKRYLSVKSDSRIPVLFMDNSPLHRSQKLENFLKANKIMVIFNLANNPELNPIERLWRYLKHPFKSRYDVKNQ